MFRGEPQNFVLNSSAKMSIKKLKANFNGLFSFWLLNAYNVPQHKKSFAKEMLISLSKIAK